MQRFHALLLCAGYLALSAVVLAPSSMAQGTSSAQGTVTGAGNLDRCNFDEDGKALFLQAVRSGLSPDGWSSASIRVMTVEAYERWAMDKAAAAGFDPSYAENMSQDRGFEILSNIEVRVETYDCREWSPGKDHDIIVVEYKKSESLAASDKRRFDLYAEKTETSEPPQPGPGQDSAGPAGPGGGLSGGVINNWRPNICAVNPQSYQCQFGGPGGGTATPAPTPKPTPKPGPTVQTPPEQKRLIRLSGANKKDRLPGLAQVDDALECVAVTIDDTAAPILKALSDVSDFFAPHYDMTKPHEGVRVIQDILLDMGLGHLASEAGPAVQATIRKYGDELAALARRQADEAAKTAGAIKASVQKQGKDLVALARRKTGEATEGVKKLVSKNSNRTRESSGSSSQCSGTRNPGAGQSAEIRRWDNPPPGVQPPPHLNTRPHPYYYQERQNSCVQACIRMVHHTIKGKDLPEGARRVVADHTAFLTKRPVRDDTGAIMRDAAGNAILAPSGTYVDQLPNLMERVGLPNTGNRHGTIEHLALATDDGIPAIAQVRRNGGLHSIVVDGVVKGPDQRYLYVRDPLYLGSDIDPAVQSMFQNLGPNVTIVPESVFAQEFTGQMLLPTP